MSEKSKGDTSRQAVTTTTSVVKNPLLSASVTGLTLDDFPNKPLLLPPVAISRESKSLVTVASHASDVENEALDEINLNTSTEESQSPLSADSNANPLWGEQHNLPADSILSQAASSLSALPSVASSVLSTFSKRIYSGTSSRERTPDINNPAGVDVNTNLDIQPPYLQSTQASQISTQQQQQQQLPFTSTPAAYYPPLGAANVLTAATEYTQQQQLANTLDNSVPPPEPPKFYTPAEVPIQPIGGAVAPPPAGTQNTYRLSAKKKAYAPIPGLSEQASAVPRLDPTGTNTPIQFPSAETQPPQFVPPAPSPLYGYPQPAIAEQQPQQQGSVAAQSRSKPEERKGLFSLTNLVPTGVLQNISGLVQSATGTFTQNQASYPPENSNNFNNFQSSAHSADASSYFSVVSGEQVNTGVPPPPTLYPSQTISQPQLSAQSNQIIEPSSIVPPPTFGFVTAPPKSASPGIVTQSHPASTNDLTTSATVAPIPFYNPAQFGQAQSQVLPSQHQFSSGVTNFFSPPAVAATPPSVANAFNTLNSGQDSTGSATAVKAVTPPLQEEVKPDSTYSTTVGRFFNPAQNLLPPLAAAQVDPQKVQLTSDLAAPPSQSLPQLDSTKSASTPPINPIFTSPATQSARSTPSAAVAPPTASPFFNPSQVPIQSEGVGVGQLLPPSTGVPPPSGGKTSFRLQKGTRLYKSPLTSAETAPVYGGPSANQAVFNPFVPSPGPTFNADITSPSTTAAPVENFFVPHSEEPQSVPLFTAELPASDSRENLHKFSSNSLFNTIEGITDSYAEKSVVHQEGETLGHKGKESLSTSTSATDKNSVDLFVEQTIEAFVPEVPNESSEPSIRQTTEIEETVSKSEERAVIEEVAAPSLPVESSESSLSTAPPPLPPQSLSAGTPTANPYRKGISAATPVLTTGAPPVLANFFTPISPQSTESGAFNFFATSQLLPPAPVPAATQAPPSIATEASIVTTSSQNTFSAAGFFVPNAPHIEPFQISPNTEINTEFPALPQPVGIAPPPLTQEIPVSGFERTTPTTSVGIAPPIGFDNIAVAQASDFKTSTAISKIDSTENTGNVNSISNFFNQTSDFSKPKAENKQLPHSDSTSFFDNFAASRQSQDSIFGTAPPAVDVLAGSQSQEQQQGTQANEDQRIQNFFNNPPPQDNNVGVGDLTYDLVHSALAVNDLPLRSLTPQSNLAEPPSSACSEFSDLSGIAQANPKIVPAETIVKRLPGKSQSENIITNNSAPKTDQDTAIKAGINDFPLEKHYEDLPEEVLKELRMAGVAEKPSHGAVTYTPAVKHWFYKRPVCSTKFVWTPFSHYDSALLETALTMEGKIDIVAVEGGRYDVNISERTKSPVYWEGQPIEVRRCSWFYKGPDSKYVPYQEDIADLLELEYKQAAESSEWHKKIILSMGEQVVFHGPTVIVHFQQQQTPDAWGGTAQPTTRPRVVKRDLEDFTIEQGESQRVDHLLFMVHGIGSACDLKLRSVEEVVDEFRSIAQQLVQSHYKNSSDMGLVGRVEVLPISWHSHLHSAEMGIDEKLRSITLESIPKLRNFTNDTLLDVLFYTSPTYCQKIMNTVTMSMNSIYRKYRQRHPDFNGGVSLAGHSLGSLIVFDLLCHQKPAKESEEQNQENPDQLYPQTSGPGMDNMLSNDEEIEARQVGYTMGPAGTGQPFIHYTQLVFQPKKFFALGSPIGMFVTIRGIDKLGLDFRLPTCAGFYNIFHPFDPVAYRIEALVNPDMSGIRPVLIPHHKGRKRMHLELKETMTRVGADLKQRFFDTFKTTLESMNFLGKSKDEAEETMKKEVDKVLDMQLALEHQNDLPPVQEDDQEQSLSSTTISPEKTRTRTDSGSTNQSDFDMVEVNFPLGKLNDSKRIDYVLQEAPLEFFNDYIFALTSHVCYWESEDTILFVMKEIYSGLGISPDSQVPQQTMTIERPNSRNSQQQSPTT